MISLNTQIRNSENAIIIILLPQNYSFKHDKDTYTAEYYSVMQLKDSIHIWSKNILKDSLFNGFYNGTSIVYDNSTTIINCSNIESTFSFNYGDVLTKSTGNQITSVKINERIYLTGLDFKSEGFDLDSFLEKIGLVENKIEIPDWLRDYKFFNDDELLDSLKNEEERLRTVKGRINDIQSELDENMNYKVALISSRDELVSIVFNILQEILSCDLSDFEDKKNEDFLIKKEDVTFIGEIKGVTSNVKSEHISQLDVHYQGYLDKLQETNSKENVKALLIINPFRNKSINARDEIHIKQINLAERNGSLIITANVLLKLFEKYKQNEIDNDSIVYLLKDKTGLLTENDF